MQRSKNFDGSVGRKSPRIRMNTGQRVSRTTPTSADRERRSQAFRQEIGSESNFRNPRSQAAGITGSPVASRRQIRTRKSPSVSPDRLSSSSSSDFSTTPRFSRRGSTSSLRGSPQTRYDRISQMREMSPLSSASGSEDGYMSSTSVGNGGNLATELDMAQKICSFLKERTVEVRQQMQQLQGGQSKEEFEDMNERAGDVENRLESHELSFSAIANRLKGQITPNEETSFRQQIADAVKLMVECDVDLEAMNARLAIIANKHVSS